jgi:hypothetical protein
VIQPDFTQETTLSISFSPMDGRLKGRKSFLISIGRNLPSKLCEKSNKTGVKKKLNLG